MAAVLCSQGSFAFAGGVGTCFRLFRASIKGGELRLLVVLTGAEHNDVCSACEGTPWLLQTARASKRPRGNKEGKRTKCQAGALWAKHAAGILRFGGDAGRCVGMVPVPTNPGRGAFVLLWWLLS